MAEKFSHSNHLQDGADAPALGYNIETPPHGNNAGLNQSGEQSSSTTNVFLCAANIIGTAQHDSKQSSEDSVMCVESTLTNDECQSGL